MLYQANFINNSHTKTISLRNGFCVTVQMLAQSSNLRDFRGLQGKKSST